jgi:hypothetical protein
MVRSNGNSDRRRATDRKVVHQGEKQNGDWKLVLRQPIYEADRIQTVSGEPGPDLDAALLAEFSAGYRHLAYAQARLGYRVKRDMPGLAGAATDELYERGSRWLRGR